MKLIAYCAALLVGLAGTLFAHCDGLDGPVVQAAADALSSKDINRVLIWVRKEDEAEIRTVFEQTLAVRNTGDDARRMADRYFFETVVRIHRAAEGAGFTGLKPAGRDLGPAIPAADRAIRDGDIDPLLQLLNGQVQQRLRDSFETVQRKKNFAKEDVERGREFVQAYVTYIHLVEGIYRQANAAVHGHFDEDSVKVGPNSQQREEGQHNEHEHGSERQAGRRTSDSLRQ